MDAVGCCPGGNVMHAAPLVSEAGTPLAMRQSLAMGHPAMMQMSAQQMGGPCAPQMMGAPMASLAHSPAAYGFGPSNS